MTCAIDYANDPKSTPIPPTSTIATPLIEASVTHSSQRKFNHPLNSFKYPSIYTYRLNGLFSTGPAVVQPPPQHTFHSATNSSPLFTCAVCMCVWGFEHDGSTQVMSQKGSFFHWETEQRTDVFQSDRKTDTERERQVHTLDDFQVRQYSEHTRGKIKPS